MLSRVSLAILVLSSAAAVFGQTPANPRIPAYGYGTIIASPTPAVVGEETSIDVTVGNNGGTDAEIAVTLSFNDWGITFGGWQEIKESVATVAAGGEVTIPYTHVFENRGHHCLEAKIASVSGGNEVTTDDRGQINLETVFAGDSTTVDIPVRNNGEKEVRLQGFRLMCPAKPGMALEDINQARKLVPCPDDFPAQIRPIEGLDDKGILVLGPGEGTMVNVIAFKDTTEPLKAALECCGAEVELKRVMVEAEDVGSGEVNHVMVDIYHASAVEMLNWPLLCCIKNVRLRVLLESILVQALELIEAGDVAGAIKLLKKYIEKATLLECDMTAEEKACVEKAISIVLDAARTLAVDMLEETKDVVSVAAKPKIAAKMATGDEMRLAGEYEAACLMFFGVVMGINNTKKEEAAPLAALLETEP